MTVESRAVDPHCFNADPDPDPDPAQNLDTDPDPDPGVGQPKMCISPGKILGTPLFMANHLSSTQVSWSILQYSLHCLGFFSFSNVVFLLNFSFSHRFFDHISNSSWWECCAGWCRGASPWRNRPSSPTFLPPMYRMPFSSRLLYLAPPPLPELLVMRDHC